MNTFAESDVERAAIDWLSTQGWSTAHGPNIAPDAENSGRVNYGESILPFRFRNALTRLNPNLPATTLDDAFRQLTCPEGATLEARNRYFHRMLVDGVTVEYRGNDGSIRGGQVRIIDFNNPASNDLLAVNQFHRR